MNHYNNDRAITCIKEDILNRKHFSEQLAKTILLQPDQDCLIVSLEAGWGVGKTSVINMIKEYLSLFPGEKIVVEYNPWLAGSDETMVQDFLVQLSGAVGGKTNNSAAMKVAEELLAYANLFSVVKYIPGMEPWASIVGDVFKSFGTATKKITKLKELDLLGKKNSVKKAMESLDIPVIVIIDDIDRLTPSETFQVLRLTKAVADFSGTTFLLSFDPLYLSEVLKKNGIVNTNEYINKIVQLRVTLPVPSFRGLNALMDSEFLSLGGDSLTSNFLDDHERTSYFYAKYVRYLLSTPRDLKRMSNFLRFIYNQVGNEVCFSDLFGLSAIATVAPKIYEHIKNFPEAYTGKNFLGESNLRSIEGSDSSKSLDPEIKQLLESSIPSNKEIVQELLSEIFPYVSNFGWSFFRTTDSDGAGRVESIQRLHIAMHYSMPDGFVTNSEVFEFLEGKINRRKYLLDVFEQNKVQRFFEVVTSQLSKYHSEAKEFMGQIYQIVLEKDRLDLGSSKLTSDVRNSVWLTFSLLNQLNDPMDYLEWISKEKDYMPISMSVIRACQNDRESISLVSKNNPQKFEDLIERFSHLVCQCLSEQKFASSTYDRELFYGLEELSHSKWKELVRNLLSQGRIVYLVELIGSTGSDSHKGKYVDLRSNWFIDTIEYESVKSMAIGVLSRGHVSEEVNLGLRSIIDGKAYYFDGTEKDMSYRNRME